MAISSMRQPSIFAPHLLERHGERIRLLAGGGRRTPNANGARMLPRRKQRRHNGGAEILERRLVAKEKRLVGHHRFDDRDHQRFGIAPLERGDELAEAAKAGLARDRQQAAFDQILLVGGQHEAGALLETFAQEIVVVRRHERSPENRRLIFGANLGERQHRRTQSGLRHRTRHAPHHAGRLVLGNHAAAGGYNFGGAARAVGSPCR